MIFCDGLTFDNASSAVQDLTRTNIATFAKHLSVNTVMFPKPQPRNVIEEIKRAVSVCERIAPRTQDLEDYSRLILMFLFSGLKVRHGRVHEGFSHDFQQASDTCFFLATNNLQIIRKNAIDKCYIKTFATLRFDTDIMSPADVDTIASKWWRCGLELGEVEIKGEYPSRLIKELKDCSSIEAMLDKVIHYQMLSPKAVRKENTKEALLVGFLYSLDIST